MKPAAKRKIKQEVQKLRAEIQRLELRLSAAIPGGTVATVYVNKIVEAKRKLTYLT